MTPQAHPRRRVGILITAVAWLNVALHVAGLALAAAFIRPGSPLSPLADRLAYLAASPPGWTLAWAVWAACAMSMIGYTVAVTIEIRSRLGRWALFVALAAVAVDLTCDDLYVFFLPSLAARAASSAQSFLHVERLINFVSLTFANGLYSVSTLLLTLALRGRLGVHPGTAWVGIGVFVSGITLAAAGVTGVPEHAFWATPPTIGLYCVWVLLVARSLTHGGGGP